MENKNILGARKWTKVINDDNEINSTIKSIIKIPLLPEYKYYVRLYFAQNGGVRLQVSQDNLGFYSIGILKDNYTKLIKVLPEILEMID